MSAPTHPVLPHPFSRPERAGAATLIGPRDLAALLQGPEPPLLLDVRPAGERELARIPGEEYSVPMPELARRLHEIPRDLPVVAYSHFGDQARRSVELLEREGFVNVAALEGGIDEYARVADPEVPRYGEVPSGEFVVQQFPRFGSGCLAYLLGDPLEREAILVDPGRETDGYLAQLKEGRWRLRAVVETHTHADHLAGHAELHARTGAPILLSARSPAQYPHRVVAEGDTVPFGRLELGVLETPGHTRDHLTLRVADTIFTGDTLLLGSCGRTDLGDGDPNLLWESLHDKILRLPEATEVYPAHFGAHHALPERYASSVGFEKGTNEALLLRTREEFLQYMTEGWPPKPRDFDAIVHENLAR